MPVPLLGLAAAVARAAPGPPDPGELGVATGREECAAADGLDVASDRGVWFLGAGGRRARRHPGHVQRRTGDLVRDQEGVRGLLARDEEGRPVAYMVCEPSTHYYRIMVCHETWSRNGGTEARRGRQYPRRPYRRKASRWGV